MISHDVTKFVVGEVIGSEGHHWDGVLIRVTSIQPEQGMLTAEVVQTTDWWGKEYGEQGGGSYQSLSVGRTVTFKPTNPNAWIPTEQSLPWFVLSIERDGSKTFVHYR